MAISTRRETHLHILQHETQITLRKIEHDSSKFHFLQHLILVSSIEAS